MEIEMVLYLPGLVREGLYFFNVHMVPVYIGEIHVGFIDTVLEDRGRDYFLCSVSVLENKREYVVSSFKQKSD
jgi:hypothetical protein